MVGLTLALLTTIVATEPAAAATKKSKVDIERANAKQLKAELANVTKQISVQEAKSQSAKQAAQVAAAKLSQARAEEAAVDARLAEVKHSAKSLAVREYMHRDPADDIRLSDNIADVARAEYLHRFAAGSANDLQDALNAARQDKERAVMNAEAASRTAAGRRKAVNDTLNALKSSRDRQLKLVGASEARLNAAIRDSEAASRIVRGKVSLTTTHGITVASSIAGRLGAMLDAAEAQGEHFGGSGYRSSDGQVAARKRNCGSSHYAVYDMPSSRCHPPTARPGQSLHEQGLAVDFTYNGSIINSHSNPGFQWLRANAARYGFYNLPSEAWHWSVNGN